MAEPSTSLAIEHRFTAMDCRARASSLPPSDRCASVPPPTRSLSTPPKTKLAFDLSTLSALPITKIASSSIDQRNEVTSLCSQNVEMLDADMEDTTTDHAHNTTPPQSIQPEDCMQIDSTHAPDFECSIENLPVVDNPPNSPEVPLLHTFRRAESPPPTIVAVRAVRRTKSTNLASPLPVRTHAETTKDAQYRSSIAEASSPPLEISTIEDLPVRTEQGLANNRSQGKRSLSPTTETPAKKSRVTDTILVSTENQQFQDDTVEVVAARPARGKPPSRKEAFKTPDPQQVDIQASPTQASSHNSSILNEYPSVRNWTPVEYAALAQACFFSFPFEQFQERRGKTRREIAEVFAAVIEAPLLSRGNLGDQRVSERRKLEREVSTMHQRYRELCDRDMQREREQLRQTVEAEVWRQMSLEGWVKLEEAKSQITEKERQMEEANAQAHQQLALRGPGRRGPRVMSVEEATEELQAASAELEKAKKAEQRKAKRIEKKEAQGNGQGRGGKKSKLDEDTPRKPGPKGKGF